MKKLRSVNGDTITEVLIASLVVVFGVLLFATMVMSSFRVINSSEDKMQAFYKDESTINMVESGEPMTANLVCGDSFENFIKEDGKKYSVNYYGSGDVALYKK